MNKILSGNKVIFFIYGLKDENINVKPARAIAYIFGMGAI